MDDKYYSIQETLQELSTEYKKLEKLRKLIVIDNSDHYSRFLSFISEATSLGIILIQHHKLFEASQILNKALKIDFFASKIPKHSLSQEKLLFYSTMAFFFYKAHKNHQALRFIYEIQSVILTANKHNKTFEADIQLCCHIVTFIIMWSIKHFQKAATYIELASDIITEVMCGNLNTKLTEENQKELCGIISLCLGGVKLKLEKNTESTIKLCREMMECIESLKIKNIAKGFIEKIEIGNINVESCESTSTFEFFPESQEHKKINDMPSLDGEMHFINQPLNDELLISQDFDNIIFEILFLKFLPEDFLQIDPEEFKEKLPLIENKPFDKGLKPNDITRKSLSIKKVKDFRAKNLTPSPMRPSSRAKIFQKLSGEVVLNASKVQSPFVRRSPSPSFVQSPYSSPENHTKIVKKEKEKIDIYKKEAISRRNRHFWVELNPLKDEKSNDRGVRVELTPVRYRFSKSRSSLRYSSPIK
ncbi:unnamed protein product [Blepharisma stoltei]|uniref:Uncharacterized protein n=1 Tax=Blepharisma stoltei TaxID=1481888 RepID=A0AAU9K965_9CILI|nr:unnamed protein product [Blepharisma stoltei]